MTAALGDLRRSTAGTSRKRGHLRRNWWIYLFLLPTVLGYGGYTVYPLVASWWYAFLDWPGFADAGTFIGIENFSRLLSDDLFWNAFGNSLLFLIIAVPLRVGLALLLALVLNSARTPFRGFFRTLFFLPVVTTGAIVGIVFTLILDGSGPVNAALIKAGLLQTRSTSSRPPAPRCTPESPSGCGSGSASR